MSLSPPLALQDAAFFKVLAVKGSEVEVFIRSYTSNGRQFWSTPIEGGGIRGNIAIAYGANDDVGKLLLYSGSGIKSFSPKTGKQTDFFPLSLEVLEDVHLTVREGYIYGCGERGIFRVKIGGGGGMGKGGQRALQPAAHCGKGIRWEGVLDRHNGWEWRDECRGSLDRAGR